MNNRTVLADFTTDMRIAKRSEVTIKDRLEVLARLLVYLEDGLLEATSEDLRAHQKRFAHLAPASVNIYTRHIKAFYSWALMRGLVQTDPAAQMIVPVVRRGRPHPTSPTDLRTVFACTTGPLRIAYLLAAFAGLRRGEICRLQRSSLDLDTATALIDGKGGKERRVPLLPPVVAEMYEYGLPRAGWVVTLAGKPYPLEQLSIDSHWHLRGLGVDSTLHSMRHSFLTYAARYTKDPLFVRDLAGHESVATTEIYMETSMADAHARLSGVTDLAGDLLSPRKLYAVGGN